jgi:hypothetical protein
VYHCCRVPKINEKEKKRRDKKKGRGREEKNKKKANGKGVGKKKPTATSHLFQMLHNFKKKILHLCHNLIYAGHVGRTKTYDLVARSYWWPGVRMDETLHCKSCDCQRVRHNN